MTREKTLKHYLFSMTKGGLCVVLFFIAVFLQTGSLQAQESSNSVSIIPYPVNLTEGLGKFVFSSKTVVALEDKANEQIVKDFFAFMGKRAGFIPKLKVGSKKGDVCILKDPELKEEAYRLSIVADKIVVKASFMHCKLSDSYYLRLLKAMKCEKTLNGQYRCWKWLMSHVSVIGD